MFSIERLSFNKMTKHDFIRQTNEIKPPGRLLEMFLLKKNTKKQKKPFQYRPFSEIA